MKYTGYGKVKDELHKDRDDFHRYNFYKKRMDAEYEEDDMEGL